MAEFNHTTVMLEEAVNALDCQKGLIYVDCTLGGGGHSFEIAKRIYPDGKLISLDVDPDAIKAATIKLDPYKEIVTIVKSNYCNIPQVLQNLNIPKITGGILFDLGASYHQFMKAEKGFSFSKDAPLDMRFDPENRISAYDVVNKYSEEELCRIFKDYGEERYYRRVARKILEKRKINTIRTTLELADIVKSVVPSAGMKIHPATRVFQALRITVNNELLNIENTLNNVITLLEKDAKIAVISFHSLEDRLVKNLFKYYSSKCRCKKEQLICSCKGEELEILTKKPIVATSEEIKKNAPSRSAKLRIAKKL